MCWAFSKYFRCIVSLNLLRSWARYYPCVADKETKAQVLLISLESTDGRARAGAHAVPLSCYTRSEKKKGKSVLLARLLPVLQGLLAYSIMCSSYEAKGFINFIL